MAVLGRIRGNFVGRVLALGFATALQVVLTVALLPLATRVLTARDYGAYALLMSVVGLAAAISDGGASLVLPAHIEVTPANQRPRLVASLAFVSCVLSLAASLLLLTAWPWRHALFPGGVLDSVPSIAVALTAAIMPARGLTSVAIAVFSTTGRGVAIAAQMMAQSATAFVATLVALFSLNLGTTSLFVGAFCGQLAALAVVLWALGRTYWWARPSRHWLGLAAVEAPSVGVAGLVDGIRGFAESASLAGLRGLDEAGYYSHARLYSGFLSSFGNTLTHNAWARSLVEARDLKSDFELTNRIWAPLHLALILFGLVFVFIGREIVEVLTNGQLTPAAVYVPIFVIIALIQNSGKAVTAIVYAKGKAGSALRFRTGVVIVGLLALYPAIVWFGIGGILGIMLVEAFVYRIRLRVLAAREREAPFQDRTVVAGVIALVAAVTYVVYANPSFSTRLGLLLCGIAACLILGWRTITDTLAVGGQIFFKRAT